VHRLSIEQSVAHWVDCGKTAGKQRGAYGVRGGTSARGATMGTTMLKAEIIPAVLALLAAFSAAIGSVIRQSSAHSITEGEVGHLTLFSMLVRNRRWWLGGLGDVASYVLIAIALDYGSVMLITCLQVTVLLFAMPIYARVTGHSITRTEWVWALVLAAALGLLIKVGDPTAGDK